MNGKSINKSKSIDSNCLIDINCYLPIDSHKVPTGSNKITLLSCESSLTAMTMHVDQGFSFANTNQMNLYQSSMVS